MILPTSSPKEPRSLSRRTQGVSFSPGPWRSPSSWRRMHFSVIRLAIGWLGRELLVLLASGAEEEARRREFGAGSDRPEAWAPRVPIGSTREAPRWRQRRPAAREPGVLGLWWCRLAGTASPASSGGVLEPAVPTAAALDWCPSRGHDRRCGMDSCWYQPGSQPWTSS